MWQVVRSYMIQAAGVDTRRQTLHVSWLTGLPPLFFGPQMAPRVAGHCTTDVWPVNKISEFFLRGRSANQKNIGSHFQICVKAYNYHGNILGGNSAFIPRLFFFPNVFLSRMIHVWTLWCEFQLKLSFIVEKTSWWASFFLCGFCKIFTCQA